MGHIFSTAANAVLPIMLLILLGFILKKKGFLSEDFLKTGNKLIFNVCLPVMLFVNVYNIESVNALRWDLILYCIALVFIIFAMGFATALMTTKVIARRGVLLQCTFRSNFAIIGLSLAAAVGGSGAESMAAVVSAFVIPVFNVLGVVALSIFDENKKRHDFAGILQSVVKNPLIIGAVTGLLCLLIRYAQECVFGEVVFSVRRELPFVLSAMNQLKNCTTPLALIILGGQFQFSAAKEAMREIVVGTLWRIVIAPVLGIGAAICLSRYTNWISFGPDEFPALVALFGSPTAVSSAIMARQMGGDGQLATQYVVWTSLGSILTLFLTVCALMSMELLAV
jgi:predicted permease